MNKSHLDQKIPPGNTCDNNLRTALHLLKLEKNLVKCREASEFSSYTKISIFFARCKVYGHLVDKMVRSRCETTILSHPRDGRVMLIP